MDNVIWLSSRVGSVTFVVPGGTLLLTFNMGPDWMKTLFIAISYVSTEN
jgi:hypothetical protein